MKIEEIETDLLIVGSGFAGLRAAISAREPDHPVADDENWLAWINLRKSDEDKMLVETEPVPLDAYPIQHRPQGPKA